MKARPWILLVAYLLLGLGLLHHLPAHFDAGREDGTGEVRHIYALQVAHFLGSCGDTGEGFKGNAVVLVFFYTEAGLKLALEVFRRGLPVLSGMVACSLFLSFSNLMLPSWRTVDTTFNIPAASEMDETARDPTLPHKISFSVCTYSLLLVEAHDLHGLQRLVKHAVVLLTRDLHVTGHQEAVGVEVLQEELVCRKKTPSRRRAESITATFIANNNQNLLEPQLNSQLTDIKTRSW